MAQPRGLGVRAVRGRPRGLRLHCRPLRHRAGRGPGCSGRQRGCHRLRSLRRPAAAAPRQRYPSIPGLWRPGVGRLSLEDKVALALAVERRALACPRGGDRRRERVFRRGEPHRHLLQHRGGGRGRALVLLRLGAGPCGPGDDRQTGLGFSVARDPEELDRGGGREPRRGRRPRRSWAPGPAARAPTRVVFAHEVMAALLSYLAQGLSADAVQKGRSLFAGKLGQTIGAGL